MKKFILIALIFIGLNAKAQYFQHLYGDPNPTSFNYVYGVNTNNINYGHLIVSNMRSSPAGPEGINVVLTDENGMPLFNNVYTVQKNGSDLGGFENHIFEWDNSPNIGVISYLYSPPGTLAYLQIDPTGNVFGVHEYSPNPNSLGQNCVIGSASNIAESADGKFLYITGSAKEVNLVPGSDTYVIKIEIATGNIIWSHIYNFSYTDPSGGSTESVFDIIESPYMPIGVPEVVIVGEYQDFVPNAHNDHEAFFLRLDANNGNPLGDVELFGLPTTPNQHSDRFEAITVSNSTAGSGLPPGSDLPIGGPGFVIGGGSYGDMSINALGNMWVLKVDPLGTNLLWTKRFQSSLWSEECHDIMERFSVANNAYEYYALGSTGANDRDVLVIKMDDWGNPMPNGEFRYDADPESIGYRLDQFNNAGPNMLNSLSIYAKTQTVPLTGTSQIFRINSYFDGTVDCNEMINTPNATQGPGKRGTATVNIVSDFSMGASLPVQVRSTIDQNLCFHPTIPWGSNALKAPGGEGSVSPNPFTVGTTYASLELEVDEPTAVTVSVYDMLGRNYYTHNFNLVKGKNNLNLDIREANMAAGMYSVRITGKNLNKNIMLMVK